MLVLLVVLAASPAWAAGARDVPEQLFGITLGGRYVTGRPERDELGDLPVRKFTGMKRHLNCGVAYFFQPIDADPRFPYAEKHEKPQNRYFETSFRLILLPIIPATIKTLAQLDSARLHWEVAAIDWVDQPKSWEDAYTWASDVCKSFRAQLTTTPAIADQREAGIYECTFAAGARELRIGSIYGKGLHLGFTQDELEKKIQSVDKTIRGLRAQSIGPE